MKRWILAATLTVAAFVPAAAVAAAPRTDARAPMRGGQECRKPDRRPVLYTVHMDMRAARAVYGDSTPATIHEHAMLDRMARCQRVPPAHKFVAWFNRTQEHAQYVRLHPPVAQPANQLVACIIRYESGGDPGAVNGKYEGLGQWDHDAWVRDGGLRYAYSPLGASYSEQVAVLNQEVRDGTTSQQTDYDPC